MEPVVFLRAADSAWQGIRDSALLQRMPEATVQNYWKMDKLGIDMEPTVNQLNAALMGAEAAVDDVRGGRSDQQACRAAATNLLRLRSAERMLWRQAAFYDFTNEQALRGEHLGTVSASVASRQVDAAESARLSAP